MADVCWLLHFCIRSFMYFYLFNFFLWVPAFHRDARFMWLHSSCWSMLSWFLVETERARKRCRGEREKRWDATVLFTAPKDSPLCGVPMEVVVEMALRFSHNVKEVLSLKNLFPAPRSVISVVEQRSYNDLKFGSSHCIWQNNSPSLFSSSVHYIYKAFPVQVGSRVWDLAP